MVTWYRLHIGVHGKPAIVMVHHCPFSPLEQTYEDPVLPFSFMHLCAPCAQPCGPGGVGAAVDSVCVRGVE